MSDDKRNLDRQKAEAFFRSTPGIITVIVIIAGALIWGVANTVIGWFAG
jgi:hypothetical protein